MLTDAKVSAAVRTVATGRKASATLADPAPRGAGRLVLLVKPGRAEWYAQRWSDGKRQLQKLGAYPALTLAEAREKHAGHKPATGRATLAQLLDAYLTTLEGRPSYRQTKGVIAAAKASIGGGRLARDITAADVANFVKPSFKAGKRAMAAKRLNTVSAAFGWAIKSANDYRAENPRDWGLTHNPCRDLPKDREASTPGQRFLSPDELRIVLGWARTGTPGSARYAAGIMLLTGQRVSEILRLTVDSYDRAERTLHWPWTKNGKPHTTAICQQAATMLDAIKPNERGQFFPGYKSADRLSIDSVSKAIRQAGFDFKFRPGDFRRTWKTLAGQAGVSKSVRDMVQNHGRTDISSKHYDRWESMPEKRAGVAIWERWLTEQLGKDHAKGNAQKVVDGE